MLLLHRLLSVFFFMANKEWNGICIPMQIVWAKKKYRKRHASFRATMYCSFVNNKVMVKPGRKLKNV